MLRSIFAVLSAPVVFGLICVPVNLLIAALAPDAFDEAQVPQTTSMLVVMLLLNEPYAVCAGYVGAWIAGRKEIEHGVAMCVLMLAIGTAVQLQYWELLPIWYHFGFLALVVGGVLVGVMLRRAFRMKGMSVAHEA